MRFASLFPATFRAATFRAAAFRAATCWLVPAALSIGTASSATAFAAPGDGAPAPESATHYADRVRPKLAEYCGDCHDPGDDANHVSFLSAGTDAGINDDRGLWKSVVEQLRNRTMPPADSDLQPSEHDRREIADWIDGFLQSTACDRGPHAGPVIARRLNRQEYDNTLRDLLFVDLKPARDFPADGAGGEGFDNNGETLFSSPILLERYLAATTEVLDAAIWTPRIKTGFAPSALLPIEAGPGPRALPPGGKVALPLTVYVAANVNVNVKFSEGAAGPALFRVDGVPAGRLTVDRAGGVPPRARTTVRLERGEHLLVVQNPGDVPLQITGLDVWDDRPDAPPLRTAAAHRKLLDLNPNARPEDPRAGAREAIARLARRGFRRPASAAEIDGLMTLYDRAQRRGDPWEEAVKLAARGVLLSPRFLFRTEPPQRDAADRVGAGETVSDGAARPVDDHALAARLSYFLWASMPDDELFALADAGTLSDPAVLDAQVDRMLTDPKAESFAEHFAGQWLGTREVGARIAPDANRFRSIFSGELLDDLHAQPTAWFLYLLRENRPLREVIDADYMILNDRLSWHYELARPPEKLRAEISKDRGFKWMHNEKVDSTFRRFKLSGDDCDRRGGVLGMGGVLLASSYSQRTSPVLRGAWVLETLVGVKVPSPPADVPELKIGRNAKGTVREKLARHRDDPACSACHNLMDPVGFALDNYDILGRWRTEEGGAEIDASATLPSGETFKGPGGLRKVLLAQEDRVVRHLTAKMLGYALGRSLEDGDDCTIDRIANEVRANGGRSRTLVKAVVRSVPFRTIARGSAPALSDERAIEERAPIENAPAAAAGAIP